MKSKLVKTAAGFTLMEIMVASTIFVVVCVSLLSLFNYVLKINRRSEALRQASQGMRNFMEFVVKEVRNGQVDYGYVDPGGETQSSIPFLSSPCGSISTFDPATNPPDGYEEQDNRLGLLDTDNAELCFYYAKADNSYVGSGKFTSATGDDGVNLVLAKGTLPVQILNPSNFKVDHLMFLIRPTKDPYYAGNPKAQPFVVIIAKFTVHLGTGEEVPIYYQTSVSTSKYDVPNSP